MRRFDADVSTSQGSIGSTGNTDGVSTTSLPAAASASTADWQIESTSGSTGE